MQSVHSNSGRNTALRMNASIITNVFIIITAAAAATIIIIAV